MTTFPARVAALVLAAGLAVAACGGDDDAAIRGIVREPLPDTSGLALPDGATGDPVPLRADEGEVFVVYFGYTNCPDVCPTTMADLRSALRDLGDDADRVEVAMATVDPDRDTPDRLIPYVQSFVDDATALYTTDDAALRAAADVLGVSYAVTETDDGDIEVLHSGFLYAIDDEGRLRVTWPFGAPPEDFVNDLEILLDEA